MHRLQHIGTSARRWLYPFILLLAAGVAYADPRLREGFSEDDGTGSAYTIADAGTQSRLGLERLTPSEIESRDFGKAGTGTSGAAGIRMLVLAGDPKQPGLYAILLTAPAGTRIEAHSHPDDRVATVISGTWYFGYGDRYDETALKELPAGSFYSEPANQPHFARTGDTPVVVYISGSGPSGTQFTGK
jgi:quercetin dioxygenase-like cupin family protein